MQPDFQVLHWKVFQDWIFGHKYHRKWRTPACYSEAVYLCSLQLRECSTRCCSEIIMCIRMCWEQKIAIEKKTPYCEQCFKAAMVQCNAWKCRLSYVLYSYDIYIPRSPEPKNSLYFSPWLTLSLWTALIHSSLFSAQWFHFFPVSLVLLVQPLTLFESLYHRLLSQIQFWPFPLTSLYSACLLCLWFVSPAHQSDFLNSQCLLTFPLQEKNTWNIFPMP